MAVDVLEITVLLALWSFTVWRFLTPQSTRGKAVRLVVLLMAVSSTFNRRDVAPIVDRLTHVPDITVPLKNLTTVAASAAVVHLAGLMSATPQASAWLRRVAYGVLAAAAAGMIAMFLIVPRSPAHGDFVAERAGTPAVTVYACLTQLGLTVGLVSALVLFRPTGRRAEPGPLRTGLRLLTAGTVVGLLFMVNRVLFQLTNAAGSRVLNGSFGVNLSRTLLASALLLFALGGAVPALGGAGRWLQRYRALHRLRPLWRDLTTAAPGVVLGTPGRLAELLALRSVEIRLYRRVIEIRDAQWLLAGAVDPAAVDRSRLPADPPPGADEALVLRTAVESGARPGPPSSRPSAAPPAGGQDLDGEVRALLAVARCYDDLAAHTATGGGRARRVVATPVESSSHNVPPSHHR